MSNRRFWPIFWTQFAGAFNDNLFKNALVIMVGFGSATAFGLPPDMLVAAATAIFILPYFLFSSHGGQLADKYEKAHLIRYIKVAEILIMLIGAIAFLVGSIELLLFVLFCMGAQSSFFGPVKYSILPQLLDDEELVGGNALVEMGTYLAILLGTIAGGILITVTAGDQPVGVYVVGASVIAIAAIGYTLSRQIVVCPPDNPDLVFRYDPVKPSWDIVKMSTKNPVVWRSILGISWFWGFGAVLLSLFPPFTKTVLHANETVATLFLAAFSVGIGAGSMLCEKFSKHRLELGLVPIGSIGMTLFTFDLFLVGVPWQMPPEAPLLGLMEFVSRPMAWRIMFDLLAISLSGGLFIVPLYTLIQLRSEASERSRIIASNNIVNAVYMVGASLILMFLQSRGVSVPVLFLIVAIANAVMTLYIYTVVPEFFIRFCAWILVNVMYRVKETGKHKIPRDGPAVVICNHVSYVDWLIVGGTIQRPLRFVMDAMFDGVPIIGVIPKHAGVIPICSRKRDPEVYEAAFDKIHEALQEGWVVGIFPEGQLTYDGDMVEFKRGIEKILERDPVPVIPVALNGMWGSWFSRSEGGAVKKPPKRFWSKVSLTIGDPISPEEASAEQLESVVRNLWEQGAP
jgi:1-acyl-sn-glycerol-3-phosphate acyltransferase